MREFSNVHSACTCARWPHIAERTGVSPTFSACTYRNWHAHIATMLMITRLAQWTQEITMYLRTRFYGLQPLGLRVDMFDSEKWTS